MDIFLIFFNMKVCCVFSLESPHRGDSNDYTQYTISCFLFSSTLHSFVVCYQYNIIHLYTFLCSLLSI